LVEVLWQELEDKKRHLDADIAALEIGRWDGGFGGANSSWAHPGAHSNSHHQWANAQAGQSLPGKKQLRRFDDFCGTKIFQKSILKTRRRKPIIRIGIDRRAQR
jgi:hypothetical protein